MVGRELAVGFFREFERLIRLDIAGDDHHRIVGRVPAAVKTDGVVAGQLFHLVAPADGRLAIRVVEVERRVDLHAEPRPRIVLDAHAFFFEDYVALGEYHRFRELKPIHAIGFVVHHRLELAGWDALVISGVVVRRECVFVSADRGDRLRETSGRIFLCALEHQMLEEMGKPGFTRRFVSGAHFVPDHVGDHRCTVIGNDDELEAVGQGEIRNLRAGAGGRTGGKQACGERDGSYE